MAKQLVLPIDAKQFTQLPIDFYPLLKSPIEAFYLWILDNAQEKGFCDFSNSKLAKRMGCTDRSIKNWKKELQERGWIRIVNVKEGLLNKTSKIYPVTPYPWRTSNANSKSGVVNDRSLGVVNDRSLGVVNDRSLGVVNDRSPNNHIIDHTISDSLSQNPELERETSIEDKSHVNEKKSSIPTVDKIAAYAIEQGYSDDQAQDVAQQFWNYYNAAGWHDSKGNLVKSWKQKFLAWEYKPSRNVSETAPAALQGPQNGNFYEFFDRDLFCADKSLDSVGRMALDMCEMQLRNVIFESLEQCKATFDEMFDRLYAQYEAGY